jgi:hypothetical protein
MTPPILAVLDAALAITTAFRTIIRPETRNLDELILIERQS